MQIDCSLPVMMKEMRGRMRGLRAPTLLFITTGLTIGIGLLVVMLMWPHASDDWTEDAAEIGRALFIGAIYCQGILAALIAPALTAGCISIEKERQTLEMLLLTRLSCANIALGKLVSSLGFLLLVLLCGLPVMAVAFLFGGLDLAQLFWSFGLIFAATMLFGAIGLFCSARMPRTASAVAGAYGGSLLWIGIIPLLFFVYASVYTYGSDNDWQETSYRIFSAICALCIGWLLTALVTMLLATAIRRPLPSWLFSGIWLLIAAAGCYAMLVHADALHQAFQNGDEEIFWLFTGNPAMAIVFTLHWNELGLTTASLEQYFVPISLGVLLLCAGLITAEAVCALKRLRDNLTNERPARRKPRKVARTARPPRQEQTV